MSRLIVKNLPNGLTLEKFKKVFNQKGEITDVQLKYTKDGKFRNFGFVGYKTEEQADEAQQYFNGTCINTAKIGVEKCTTLSDGSKPRSWSKYAKDSSAYKKIHGIVDEKPKPVERVKEDAATKRKNTAKKIQDLLDKHKDDPLFVEFMNVHAKKNKKLWGDDLSFISNPIIEDKNQEKQIESSATLPDDSSNEKPANQSISDLEYMKCLMKKLGKKKDSAQPADDKEPEKESSSLKTKTKIKKPKNRVLYMVKINGLPFACKKKDVKDFFRPLVPFTIRIPRSNKAKVLKGFCYVGFRSEEERKKALFKNRSFLGEHRVNVDKYDNKNNAVIEEEENKKHKSQEESLKNEESIAESGKIFVRNLPYITTEDELQTLFEKFGPVTEVNLPVDKLTHQSKGFAHVTFMLPEDAVKAYSELDGSVFSGRMLHLLPGKQKEEANSDDENLTYKQKKELKQKSQSNSSHNWNTLFLGANAVADVIADIYNTSKEQLLKGDSTMSAAVKLALGETQLVTDTRKFLEDSGVCLTAFNEPPKKRSKTVILVKNLPANTKTDEITKVFQPFGLISRLIIPPSGITALVEFVEPSEARHAFSKLAYSKFKYLPLYLEWAPSNVFTTPPPKVDIPTKEADVPSQNETEVKDKVENDEDAPESDSILFVKGLNFSTREEQLKQHFERCGRVYSVTVAMKNDPKNPGNRLSMGYGFVHYYEKSASEKALKTLQSSQVDGKEIEIKRSERTGSTEVKTARKKSEVGKQTGTKILVRNIPFQANRRELLDVFGTFGEIKSLRMPKKMIPGENQHRGFCFVEYYNNSDAKNSFNALCQSTHLYGRRLVLEWAKPEDDGEMVHSIRKRTAEIFNMDAPGGKKSRKAVAEIGDEVAGGEDDNE